MGTNIFYHPGTVPAALVSAVADSPACDDRVDVTETFTSVQTPTPRVPRPDLGIKLASAVRENLLNDADLGGLYMLMGSKIEIRKRVVSHVNTLYLPVDTTGKVLTSDWTEMDIRKLHGFLSIYLVTNRPSLDFTLYISPRLYIKFV